MNEDNRTPGDQEHAIRLAHYWLSGGLDTHTEGELRFCVKTACDVLANALQTMTETRKVTMNEDNHIQEAAPSTLASAELRTLEAELAALLNCHSQENESNTPDFILAQYLLGCLAVFTTAVQQRETWWGRNAAPSEPGSSLDEPSDSPQGDPG